VQDVSDGLEGDQNEAASAVDSGAMSAAEIAAVVGPVTTLAGALGGVWLTQRYQRDQELRDAKRAAYVRWVQFAENLGTWAFQPGAHFGDFLQGLHDRMAELDLVASRKVRQAVQAYLDALGPVARQMNAAAGQLDPQVPPHEHATAMADIIRAMDPHREQVLEAMRQDLGFK
jgi:hypothetical protein